MARPMLQAWSSRTTGWMSLTVIAVSMVAAGWLVGLLSSGGAEAQSRTPATAGLLAVIDVHEVARQLGERDRLQVVLDAKQQEFQDRLTLLQQGYTEQYEARRDAIGTPASAEQQRELEQLSLSLNTQILQEREAAKVEYNQFQLELEEKFAERLRPYALQIATAQGFSVVVRRERVFAMAEGVDITTSVIAELKRIPEFTGGSPFVPARRPTVGVSQPSGGQFNPDNQRR